MSKIDPAGKVPFGWPQEAKIKDDNAVLFHLPPTGGAQASLESLQNNRERLKRDKIPTVLKNVIDATKEGVIPGALSLPLIANHPFETINMLAALLKQTFEEEGHG